ncbi:class I SAM-dependent methyltransferase [Sorangium sp. So ce1024]|uniref:class I SAM-dependent methyltransferase n=2 Tax=unclassified Sorangium TaxID=2621164 RepID=UPI003F047A65
MRDPSDSERRRRGEVPRAAGRRSGAADVPSRADHEREVVAALRRKALLERVTRRTRANVEIVVPAVPSLIDRYMDMLADHFFALGRPFTRSDIASLRALLLDKLEEAFRASPYSNVFIRYATDEPPSVGITYGVAAASSSLEDEYAYWTRTREPPLFGSLPDAKLMESLRALAVPPGAAILDVGAGTGRNSLPLARLGYAVDAVEPAPALADALDAEVAREALAVRVIRADALRDELPLQAAGYAFAVVAEVTSHFRGAGDLRALFERLARLVAPGGHALVSAFVSAPDYEPDATAREVAQVLWSTFFTPAELDAAASGLPLALVSDDDALAFERAHLPEDAWPPTGWYESWASGQDLFGTDLVKPPVSLRWLLYRRD